MTFRSALAFGVRTLLGWMRAYSFDKRFVVDLGRPQSLLKTDRLLPERDVLRADFVMSRRPFLERGLRRANSMIAQATRASDVIDKVFGDLAIAIDTRCTGCVR